MQQTTRFPTCIVDAEREAAAERERKQVSARARLRYRSLAQRQTACLKAIEARKLGNRIKSFIHRCFGSLPPSLPASAFDSPTAIMSPRATGSAPAQASPDYVLHGDDGPSTATETLSFSRFTAGVRALYPRSRAAASPSNDTAALRVPLASASVELIPSTIAVAATNTERERLVGPMIAADIADGYAPLSTP